MGLFPVLEHETGELSVYGKLLAEALSLTQLHRFVHKQWRGRPCEDRRALIAAFLAKSIQNLATTRQLIDRLKTDSQLRSLGGWQTIGAVPSESTFSRAFADFARRKLPERIHEALVRLTQHNRIFGHIARDSTAIEAREHCPDTPPPKPKGRHNRATARERGPITRRQRPMKLDEMLAGLSQDCAIGVKAKSKGHTHYWRGYKLHLDVADGQIPITALLTAANVHDANAILEHSRQLGHIPIVDPHGRRATRVRSQLPKIFPSKPKPQLCPAKAERYKERTMVERVNARLKDEFGGRTLRVRGAAKVMAHLMFGVITLTVDQLQKLITSSRSENKSLRKYPPVDRWPSRHAHAYLWMVRLRNKKIAPKTADGPKWLPEYPPHSLTPGRNRKAA